MTCSGLRRRYPDYFIAKKKVETAEGTDLGKLCSVLMKEYPGAPCDTRDGIKLDLPTGWVQIRKSNTEPIIRVYVEDRQREMAEKLADKIITIVRNL
jgi:phosphomannomutase